MSNRASPISVILRAAKAIVVVLATIVILFEEWLWEPLKRMMLAFSRLPVIRQLAVRITRMSPNAALVLYLLPMVTLLPFKIIGLWLISHGHTVFGLITFLSAKVTGTALFAWLFSLTKPALLQIGWFAKAYDWVSQLSIAAHAWLNRQAIYRTTKAIAVEIRDRLRKLLRT